MTQKIENFKIGTLVKSNRDYKSFKMGEILKIYDGDCISQSFLSGHRETGLTYDEIIENFKVVNSLDDIDNLKEKAFLIKTYTEELKECDEYKYCTYEQLLEEAMDSIHHLEKHKIYYPELKFISDNMNIEMVAQCSCCGKILLPDDECYSDSLNGNGNASLCDHCSIMNEETDNYEKYVNQDIIEKITGLKFSTHIGNIGSKIEEFNQYIKDNKLNFSVFNEDSENSTTFFSFMEERTNWNTCDCCGLIEVSTDLIWDSDEVYDEDYQNFRFLRATSIPSDAFCKSCLDLAGQIAKPDLETITSRIIVNNLIFRVGEFVLLENVDWDNKPRVSNYIAKISSIDETKETYTLEEYGDVEFKEDEFYDVINEAYLMEYGDFISDNYSDLSGKVDEWTSPNHEGIADIDYAFKNFGYKNEFIEYLKSKDLPYGRFLESKFKVGDKFKVHFDYYDKGKFTEHIIAKIDTSFSKANEIVYWSDDAVYIAESELDKQYKLKEIFGDDWIDNLPSKENPNISQKIVEITKMGDNRLPFLEQLKDLDIGGLEVEEKTLFGKLSLDEQIYYLKAIIEDLEDYKKI